MARATGAVGTWNKVRLLQVEEIKRVSQELELKDVLNSYGKWMVGCIVRIPRFKSFSFPPPKSCEHSERTCPGRSDNAPLQESASQSFLNRKQKGET